MHSWKNRPVKYTIWIWPYRSTWRSCPCTSSLVAADEHFHTKESGYQLEETARSSQENMDLSDSRWYWNVIARSLGCLHSSWPWKRDATVSEDYAPMMRRRRKRRREFPLEIYSGSSAGKSRAAIPEGGESLTMRSFRNNPGQTDGFAITICHNTRRADAR